MNYTLNTRRSILSCLILIGLATGGCGGGSGSNTVSTPTPTVSPTQTPDDGNQDNTVVTQVDILHDYKVELLKNETYYFPANTPNDEKMGIQPLQQFDFIIVGHDIDPTGNKQNSTDLIPGTYTHMLMYLGKDSDGLAYGVEMNVNIDAKLEIDEDGSIQMDGQLFIYCLGSDFNKKCPTDNYIWGLETYDYLWAKRLKPQLHDKLEAHKESVLSRIKQDLQNHFPFQLPLKVDLDNKIFQLINDGRKNGTDCTAYMVLLLEESASVCMDNIHITADEMKEYYINDPRGKKVYIPAKDNPYGIDIYASDLFTTFGFTLENNPPRETKCPDGRKVIGIPTPQKVFQSPSLTEIPLTE